MGITTSFSPYRFTNSRISQDLLRCSSRFDNSIHETKLFRSKGLLGLAKFIVREFPNGIKIFNPACSYGHEPYSMALVMADQLGDMKQVAKKYPISASDRFKEIINFAKCGILWIDDKNLDTLTNFRAGEHIINPIKVDNETTEFQVSEELFDTVSFRENDLVDEVRSIGPGLPVVAIIKSVWYYLDADKVNNLVLALRDSLPSGSILAITNGDSKFCFYKNRLLGDYFTSTDLYNDISSKLEEKDIFWEKTVFQKR
jgi:chemotaxis methyl-accepting protein methylase